MSEYVPRSITGAEAALAALFAACAKPGGECLRLEVREEKCFRPDVWVSVGTVSLHPESPAASPDTEDGSALLQRAFRYGFFDWELPGEECLTSKLTDALANEITDHQNSDRISRDISKVAAGVACAAIRCGLAHPVLDATTLSKLPFRRTVGIVIDTSAVLQGGLDFAARHLTPGARLRVPAVVQMEIQNFVDRYFSRRYKKPRSGMLVDHMLSQAGQRALIRLGRAHRVERPRLGAEPLRGIVQPDSDAEDRNLGLQMVQRSFADRLILETAVQRRDDAAPDHPVMLMTADQGLARMALAEGIEPIFFDTNAASALLGSTLSGVTFKPFVNDGLRTYPVSLGATLWELAVTFGSARLIGVASGDSFEAVAIGERSSDAREDLLWTRAVSTPAAATPSSPIKAAPDSTEADSTGATTSTIIPSPRSRALSGAYSFSPGSMIDLMAALDQHAALYDVAGMEAAHVNKRVSYEQYWRFLCAGGFAVTSGAELQKTDLLSSLIRSMTDGAFDEMRELLSLVPSFGAFLTRMAVASPLTQDDSKIRATAFRPYCALAELCCAGVRFADAGIYATLENPTPEHFSRPALVAYDTVRQGEDYALTGAWLDEMTKRFGIHPVRARQRLAEAHQSGYIRRYVEGSTPETRYGNRNLHVFSFDGGVPKVRNVNLYHGDFLMPGRAAVSIRLSKGER